MAQRDETTTQRKGSYSAPALDKAFLIIELLANNPQGLLASEMATALGRSLGELFRIVVVMEEAGYLQKSRVTDRYTVTYKFLDVAYRATPARKLVVTAQPEMQALAAAIGQSCHLVVLQGGEGLIIAREENPGVRGFALRVGASIDLVRSCSGSILLAFSSEEVAERLLARAAALRKEPVGHGALSTRLQKVRADGYVLRESAVTRGVTDISCPIFGFDGELLAALTVPFMDLIDGSQLVSIEDACVELRATAQRISVALGWQPPGAQAD
ncbi:IclR family transcriptional regulator [Sphingomonas hengshuiensis]|uniref:IclR family transcriptional regulator n=1 Tax=Sphingomonas hengshuiensis TaxID=1609977 RepID=A0A7U4JAH1_9SPHN|nr:IclR family transcriptional regulator [Sphingomonas hengshuiensis]AJP73255.1 IclR family transcriptional regulator [Sphingomonas hengshuiensis]